ncbi:MAG: Uncharacterized protein Athens071416_284 [Parcubacteria group bacterium Athens0714_16]|nr:MAG: Uncharacterized protein Athens071416_284 [Parcubacteria group bacterium Athens0714_16]
MKQMNYKKGQVMLGIVIMFVVISLSVVSGVAWNVQKEVATESNLSSSAKSYYSAESITEDVVYRIKNGIQVSPTETININDAIGTAVVSDSSGIKTISSSGDSRGAIRKVSVSLTEGSGVAFNYGIQTGVGGFVMSGGARINGNVYSNGDIIATNGVVITGSAVAANSSAISADQINDTPSTPPSSITFANVSATQDTAQSFQVSSTGQINNVQFYLKRVGTSLPANITVKIVTDNAGSPSTNILDTATITAGMVTTSYGWITATFTENRELVSGVTYWVVLDGGTSSNKYYILGANNTYVNGVAKIYNGSSWVATSPSGLDSYFKLYMGGLNSILGGGTYVGSVYIGSAGVGDAWAHTVTGASVAGNLYCQVGDDNNKVCNTSKGDPSPQGFPISDANIDVWKEEAEAGGVINGNYSVGWQGATLGPKKITGNLTVTGGGIFTVSGTLWVQGTISLSGGGSIKLAASYGAKSGVLISDNRITLAGGGDVSGSGTSGSYILILTTSDCPTSLSCGGSNAIEVGGGAGAMILNAQKGTIHLGGGVSLKEATAYKITADGGAVITYESGLANPNFSSGPGGGYNISGWAEVE